MVDKIREKPLGNRQSGAVGRKGVVAIPRSLANQVNDGKQRASRSLRGQQFANSIAQPDPSERAENNTIVQG